MSVGALEQTNHKAGDIQSATAYSSEVPAGIVDDEAMLQVVSRDEPGDLGLPASITSSGPSVRPTSTSDPKLKTPHHPGQLAPGQPGFGHSELVGDQGRGGEDLLPSIPANLSCSLSAQRFDKSQNPNCLYLLTLPLDPPFSLSIAMSSQVTAAEAPSTSLFSSLVDFFVPT